MILLNKCGREVLAAFKDAGLEVTIKPGSKHYLVYRDEELVYKFGQGTRPPGVGETNPRKNNSGPFGA